MPGPRLAHISPGRILLMSFLFVIGVGTFLLWLPISRVVDIPFLDLLFTSVSATCVTGLHVLSMSYFTFFGKCVILALIQIGGLGLMTLSFFLISLIMNLRFITKLIAGQILEFELFSKIKTFLTLIIGMTVVSELIGAIFLYFPFRQIFETKKAIFYAVFHSVSAFCNSGTCLFENSLAQHTQTPLVLIPISLLIFVGGVGFIVWYEIINLIGNTIKNFKTEERKKMCISLHTKVVLTTTFILILMGAFFFMFLEQNSTMQGMGTFNKIVNSFFMSITTRTAGFNTLNTAQLSLPTLFTFIILMFVGTSPNSTGSGIKTTTFALFLKTIGTFVKNKPSVEMYGRRIPSELIAKTTVIVALAMSWIGITTFILLLTEPKFSFMQIFFESVSAFSTTGLSTGITPYLSQAGKALLMISMLIGRIGSLTLALALTVRKEIQLYRYPEERVIIG